MSTIRTQINAGTIQIPVREIFTQSKSGMLLDITDNIFIPDEWTRALGTGLQKLSRSFKNSALIEVGCGMGVVMAGLMTLKNSPAIYTGVDLHPAAVRATQALADKHGWDFDIQESDLLTNISAKTLRRAKHIVACIPQVPNQSVNLMEKDNSAHYYVPDGSKWDIYSLGLNFRLLEQARARAPQAQVTLNLAGRPGERRLTEMFAEAGYNSRPIHQDMIAQHAGTSLASLAQLEKQGHEDFEFYSDELGAEPISAGVAEERRLAQQSVYHRIYVFSAIPA